MFPDEAFDNVKALVNDADNLRRAFNHILQGHLIELGDAISGLIPGRSDLSSDQVLRMARELLPLDLRPFVQLTAARPGDGGWDLEWKVTDPPAPENMPVDRPNPTTNRGDADDQEDR